MNIQEKMYDKLEDIDRRVQKIAIDIAFWKGKASAIVFVSGAVGAAVSMYIKGA